MDENVKDIFWQMLRTIEVKAKKDEVLELHLIESAYKVFNEHHGSNLVPEHKR